MGDEELDPAGGPEVAEACAAEVAEQTDVGDEEACYEDEDEWGGPGGEFVGADARFMVRICRRVD